MDHKIRRDNIFLFIITVSKTIDYDTIFKDCFFTKKVVLFSIKTFLFMYESLTTIYDTIKSKKG